MGGGGGGGGSQENGPLVEKFTRQKEQEGPGRKTKVEIRKGNQMTAAGFQTGCVCVGGGGGRGIRHPRSPFRAMLEYGDYGTHTDAIQ